MPRLMQVLILAVLANGHDLCQDHTRNLEELRVELDAVKSTLVDRDSQFSKLKDEHDSLTAMHTQELLQVRTSLEAELVKAQDQILVNYNAYQKAVEDYNRAKSESATATALIQELDDIRKQKQSLQSQLTDCEIFKSSANQETEAALRKALSSEKALTRDLSMTQERLEGLQNKILTIEHLKLLSTNTLRFYKAVFHHFQTVFKRFEKAEIGKASLYVVGIARLKLIIWEKTMMRPMYDLILQRMLQVFTNPIIHDLYIEAEHIFTWMCLHTDSLMEHVIQVLSKVDPEIREIIPIDFADRIVTFTYLYWVSHYVVTGFLRVITFTFALLVTKPTEKLRRLYHGLYTNHKASGIDKGSVKATANNSKCI